MCLGTCDNIQFSLGICVFYIPTNSMPIPIFSPDKGKLFKTFKGLKKKKYWGTLIFSHLGLSF